MCLKPRWHVPVQNLVKYPPPPGDKTNYIIFHYSSIKVPSDAVFKIGKKVSKEYNLLTLSSLGGLNQPLLGGFLLAEIYQVHIQSRNFLTFSFYSCHDQKLIF